jgi:hypothetical protein
MHRFRDKVEKIKPKLDKQAEKNARTHTTM